VAEAHASTTYGDRLIKNKIFHTDIVYLNLA